MTVKALKPLKFKTCNGIVEIRQGQVFKPADPHKLIKAGLVVPATDQVGRPYWQRPDGRCYACGSRDAWRSDYKLTCTSCHPPAGPALVREWIKGTA